MQRVLLTLLIPMLAVVGSACRDEGSLTSPTSATVGVHGIANGVTADRKTTGEPDDVLDALDRIAPAFGETNQANQVRAALRQLVDAIRDGDDAATTRGAERLSESLDRLATLGDRGLGAEIDAVRLVADARK
jgi:hypothetical protein